MHSRRVPCLFLLFAFALLMAGARPAGAQIVVSGGPAQSVRTVQIWGESCLPAAFCLPGHVLPIRLVSPRQMRDLAADGDKHGADDYSRVDGLFQSGPPRIALRVEEGADPDLFTLAHEYGHFVWTELFSRGDRTRYETLYRRQRDAHSLVTRYAASDPEEGFAEAFSFYVSEPVLLQRRDPLSARFLSEWAAAHLPKKS